MSILVAAKASEFAAAEAAIGPLPGFRHLRRPETGLLMLGGRIGGEGAQFNLGEATVTRCHIVTETGTEGAAYHLGRDLAKAEKAALFEALAREASWRHKVEAALLAPVKARVDEERRSKAADTAATRVEFFTMARGEDPR
ncbi:MAG: phosphonate C-P lyase system protein PhnG [Hyphomicrobiales bacterium]|nr:phosphonate C-P lyase system protein PhnG [Hyphomicrobiales bacterium]